MNDIYNILNMTTKKSFKKSKDITKSPTLNKIKDNKVIIPCEYLSPYKPSM